MQPHCLHGASGIAGAQRVHDSVLSLVSTATVFGTPREVTLSELAIESFYPADATTAEFFRSHETAGSG